MVAEGFGAQDKVSKAGDTMAGPLDSSSSITAGVVALTDGATIALNAAAGNHFRVTLGGNRTLGTPSNPEDGQKITLEVTQDGTGHRTLTLPGGGFVFGTDISLLTLSTGAGVTDVVGLTYSASLGLWMVTGLARGY